MTQRLNRRKWLATTGLAALSACGRSRGKGFFGYGLVANAGDNSLAAIDLTTFRIAATVGLGAAPSQIVTSGARSFVLTPSTGTIHLIDERLQRAGSGRLAGEVSEIRMAADGGSLWAVAQRNELIQVDLTTLHPLSRYKSSIAAHTVDLSTTGYAAIGSRTGGIELIELASGKKTRVETPALGAIKFRKDGKVLLAANVQNRSLLALDVPTLETLAELPLAMQPDHLCFNADQGQLFVSGAGMDGVAVVFPFNALEVDQTLLAGRTPGAMACSETPAYLFVASETGSNVCVLNIDTRKPIGFVDLGGQPSFITVTPDSQYALILDRVAGDMGVIHVPAIRANRLKTGAALYTMVSVGSQPVDVVVVPRVA